MNHSVEGFACYSVALPSDKWFTDYSCDSRIIAGGKRSFFEKGPSLFLLGYIDFVTDLKIPIRPDIKKSPRLQFLDTGLLNFFVGLQNHYFGQEDLHGFYRGLIAEHIVGQELLSWPEKSKRIWIFGLLELLLFALPIDRQTRKQK